MYEAGLFVKSKRAFSVLGNIPPVHTVNKGFTYTTSLLEIL